MRFVSITHFNWTRLSLNAKFVLATATLFVTTYTTKYFYRLLVGILRYHIEYFLAASGFASPMKSCQAVKLIKSPWQELSDGDWFFLQRCMGSDMGLMRQGELQTLMWESFLRALSPTQFPGITIALTSIVFIPFYLLPWLHERRREIEEQVSQLWFSESNIYRLYRLLVLLSQQSTLLSILAII